MDSLTKELLEACDSVLECLGEDDLPDDGELMGAAVTDRFRAAVEEMKRAGH